ncbi:MAG: type I secretion system permease/ATPase [Rhodobacteraceae bacterium]|nr:type I secretion system permease/ATPase [Paracoccaceae bacterium]
MSQRATTQDPVGTDELTAQRRANARLLWAVFLFSVFTNLLMLTGPIYMLQVYDRVLGSQSVPTLVNLTILIAFLFLMMGLLDYARGRIVARVGARLQDNMDARVFSAALTQARRQAKQQTGLQDLEAVQRLLSSPVFLAIFDIPWTPIFTAVIFILHPWLGWLAITGGVLLILITAANQATTRDPLKISGTAKMNTDRMAANLQSESEVLYSLGMQGAAFKRWRGQRGEALGQSIKSSDLVGGFTTLTKTLRLFLQSAMLGLGALLVLRGELTAGAMIAGSILLGRALAPIELAIGQWALFQRAREGWAKLRQLLNHIPPEPARLPLPRPAARLDVHQLAVVPLGQSQPNLRGVTFRLKPGQAVGVFGPSGAGKSTLAKALTGVWPPAAGQIRLGGATLDQYDPEVLGGLIGYLPQTVTLFDGTIAENIARLSTNPDPQAVVKAAQKAAVHDMILELPKGYDTPVKAIGSRLSGGQIQRVGLARALYGEPVLLILDEPNSNLDAKGSDALNQAIREMKANDCGVLIMAHRPSIVQECEMCLILDKGIPKIFGPRDEVLEKAIVNYQDVASGKAAGGLS